MTQGTTEAMRAGRKPRRPARPQEKPPARLARVKVPALPSMPFEQLRQLPPLAAVYFVTYGGQVLYIGRTANLWARWNSSGAMSHHAYPYFDGVPGVAVAWLEMPEKWQRATEADLLAQFAPPYNHTGALGLRLRTPLREHIDDAGNFAPDMTKANRAQGVGLKLEGAALERLTALARAQKVSLSAAAEKILLEKLLD